MPTAVQLELSPTRCMRLAANCDDDVLSVGKYLLRNNGRELPAKLFFKRPAITEPQLSVQRINWFLSKLQKTRVRIQKVQLFFGFLKLFPTSRDSELLATRFLGVIRSLPCLKEFECVGDWRLGDDTSPGTSPRYLTFVLSEARALKRFSCWFYQINDTPQELGEFANALRGHPTLEDFAFRGCSLAPTCRSATYIDPVLFALRSVPNLTAVDPCFFGSLEGDDDHPSRFATTISAVKEICGHPKITKLFLLDFPVLSSRSHLEAVLEAKTNLQELKIELHMEDDHEYSRLILILEQCIAIECLEVALKRLPLDEQRISKSTAKQKQQGNFIQIIRALRHNTNLSQLIFLPGGIYLPGGISHPYELVPTSQADHEICAMLQDNTTLVDLDFDDHPARQVEWFPQKNFWLQLNRYGRKELLRSTSSTTANTTSNKNHADDDAWISILAKASNDVPALYYFLSLNPGLCNPACSHQVRKGSRLDADEERPTKKKRNNPSAHDNAKQTDAMA